MTDLKDPMQDLEKELTCLIEKDYLLKTRAAQGCGLTAWLQGVMFYFVVVPVIKMRYIVIGNRHLSDNGSQISLETV